MFLDFSIDYDNNNNNFERILLFEQVYRFFLFSQINFLLKDFPPNIQPAIWFLSQVNNLSNIVTGLLNHLKLCKQSAEFSEVKKYFFEKLFLPLELRRRTFLSENFSNSALSMESCFFFRLSDFEASVLLNEQQEHQQTTCLQSCARIVQQNL